MAKRPIPVARQADRKPLFTVPRSKFRVEHFRASGAGGQHRNKTDSATRITHIDSGASGQATESRSQQENTRTALKRLTQTPTFRLWVHEKIREIDRGITLEKALAAQLEEDMHLGRIRVEVHDQNGRWIPAPPQLMREGS